MREFLCDICPSVTNSLNSGRFSPFLRTSYKKNTPTLLLMCSLKLGAFLPLRLCYDIVLYVVILKVVNPLDLFF